MAYFHATTNFNASEFRCKCGQYNNSKAKKECAQCQGYGAGISPILTNTLQKLRNKIGKSITVVRGYSCIDYDTKLSGTKTKDMSMHSAGLAADIYVEGMTPSELAQKAYEVGFDGIGTFQNKTFVHVDVRGYKFYFGTFNKKVDPNSQPVGNGQAFGDLLINQHAETIKSYPGITSLYYYKGKTAKVSTVPNSKAKNKLNVTKAKANLNELGDIKSGSAYTKDPNYIIWTTDKELQIASILKMFSITLATFKKLNPTLANNKTIAKGVNIYLPNSAKNAVAKIIANDAKAKAAALFAAAAKIANKGKAVNKKVATKYTTKTTTTVKSVSDKKTTAHGGAYDDTRLDNFDLPGYKNAYMEVYREGNSGKDSLIKTIGFAISPSSISDLRSNIINVTKTMGGVIVDSRGENQGQVGISGLIIDTYDFQEKNIFLQNYCNNIVDKMNGGLEYTNMTYIKLHVEGWVYVGKITSMNFQKDASRQILYSYNMTLVVLKAAYEYKTSTALTDYDYQTWKELMSTKSKKVPVVIKPKAKPLEPSVYPITLASYDKVIKSKNQANIKKLTTTISYIQDHFVTLGYLTKNKYKVGAFDTTFINCLKKHWNVVTVTQKLANEIYAAALQKQKNKTKPKTTTKKVASNGIHQTKIAPKKTTKAVKKIVKKK